MTTDFLLKRTDTDDFAFHFLVKLLDQELWKELKEDQSTYDQHNKVPGIATAVLVYYNEEPVACGCFKPFDGMTVEIKRMFVHKAWRQKGLSKKVLQELEQWAIELGYRFAVLETSIHFAKAIGLYKASGYEVVPNYPPYLGLSESLCMKKSLC